MRLFALRREAGAFACISGAMICYASVPVFLKHFSGFLDPWTVNGIRYTTAALICCPLGLLLLRGRPEARNIWRAALLPGIVNLCGQIGWAMTPYYNDATVIGFAIRLSFPMTLLFSLWLVPSDRLLMKSGRFWIGAGVCGLGLYTLYSTALRAGHGTSPRGLLIIVITAVFWGLYSVSVKRNLAKFPASAAFGVVALYTAIGLLTLMLVKGRPEHLLHLAATDWFWLVLSGMLGIAIAHTLIYRALAVLGPALCGGIQLLGPFLTWLGAVWVLGETLGGVQLTGGIMIVTGAFLMILAWTRIHP